MYHTHMIKAIFVDPKEIEGLDKSGANYLMIVGENLDRDLWQRLRNLGMTLSISFVAFDRGGCPANPKAREKLLGRIECYLKFKPEALWLDHFRFDGHWESAYVKTSADKGNIIPGIHQKCEWCKGKNRVEILSGLAKEVMEKVRDKAKVGYFAVPFKSEEVPEVVSGLGQDQAVLGKIFDMSSPMLYHRMIKRPVSYISEYVKWVHTQTSKPVLPIIQIKDMPDDLEDKLSEEEINQAFQEAKKPPSVGVAFFWWRHAIEKRKTRAIRTLFNKQ